MERKKKNIRTSLNFCISRNLLKKLYMIFFLNIAFRSRREKKSTKLLNKLRVISTQSHLIEYIDSISQNRMYKFRILNRDLQEQSTSSKLFIISKTLIFVYPNNIKTEILEQSLLRIFLNIFIDFIDPWSQQNGSCDSESVEFPWSKFTHYLKNPLIRNLKLPHF